MFYTKILGGKFSNFGGELMEGNIILEGTFGGKLFLEGNHSIFWQETNFFGGKIFFGGKFKFKIQTPGAAEEPRRTWSYY